MTGAAAIARQGQINFDRINQAALAVLPSLLRQWLPDGKQIGKEYTAISPHSVDRGLGSLSVNTRTGQWADRATRKTGGDPISLVAYLGDISQVEAAERLAAMLGIEARDE